MTDLTKLLEQATEQAVELAKNAAQASTVLEALAKTGQDLEENLEEEMESVHEEVRSLSALLKQVAADVASARVDAVADLDGAAAEAATTGTEAASDFDLVQSSLEALAEHQQQVGKQVDGLAQAAEAELGRVEGAMEAAGDGMDTHLRAAGNAALEFERSRGALQAALQTRYEAWKKALDAECDGAETQAGAWMAGFEGLEKDHGQDAEELLRSVSRRQDTAVSTVRETLGTKLKDALTALADAFAETLGEYLARAGVVHEAVEKGHQEAVEKAEEVKGLADEVQASLLNSISALG